MNHLAEALKTHNLEFVRSLGKGSYGEVFVAKNTYYGEYFAVKHSTNLELKHEANIMSGLTNPYIAKIYKYFEIGKNCFLVIHYYPNGTLQNLIEKQKYLHSQSIMIYFKLIASAVNHMHQKKIVHRDIKPQNILIDEHRYPKLADFGISKYVNEASTNESNAGSISYMAPELFITKQVDLYKADIWSLGITLFVMATGKLPWKHSSRESRISEIKNGIFEIPETVNRHIAKLIRKLCAPEPNARPTAQDLVDHLISIPKVLPATSTVALRTLTLPQQAAMQDRIGSGRAKSPLNVYSSRSRLGRLGQVNRISYLRRQSFLLDSSSPSDSVMIEQN